jgi:hypothetical protein
MLYVYFEDNLNVLKGTILYNYNFLLSVFRARDEYIIQAKTEVVMSCWQFGSVRRGDG